MAGSAHFLKTLWKRKFRSSESTGFLPLTKPQSQGTGVACQKPTKTSFKQQQTVNTGSLSTPISLPSKQKPIKTKLKSSKASTGKNCHPFFLLQLLQGSDLQWKLTQKLRPTSPCNRASTGPQTPMLQSFSRAATFALLGPFLNNNIHVEIYVYITLNVNILFSYCFRQTYSFLGDEKLSISSEYLHFFRSFFHLVIKRY